MTVTLLTTLLLSVTQVRAESKLGNAWVGAGALGYTMGQSSGNASGDASALGAVYPTLGIGIDANVYDFLYAGLEFAFTPIPKEQKGNSASTQVLLISVPVKARPWGEGLDFKLGPGVLFYYIDGKDGIVQVNNGTSTSPFARPGRSVTSRIFTVDAGISYRAPMNVVISLDALIGGVLASRHTVSGLLQVSYSFL